MNGSVVWIVFATDLKNTLRDRRTWLAMVVVPLLLIPALLIAGPSALEQQNERLEESPPVVGVVGAEHAPELVEFIRALGRVRLVADDEARVGVRGVKAVLRVAPGAQARIDEGTQGRVSVEYDAADRISEVASARLQQALNAYSQQVVAERLGARGIDPALLRPVDVSVTNVAPEERVGGAFLAMIMPMMLAVWAALGGMYAAIDAVAGEKERGTLEPLLATPPDRRSIVIGKYLVVVVTSVVASAISIAGMFIAFWIKPEVLLGDAAGAASFSLPPVTVVLTLGIAVLLAGFFSSLELAVSAFARSFREAQSYLSPLSLVAVLPAVFTQFISPADAAPVLYAVPMINAIFVFKELIMGDVVWAHIGSTTAWSLVWIALGLRLATGAFKKESILFRT